ncbi:golgin subfamily A member 2-like isoform X1 [Aotus nancymaae]|uniref:golgin subfamily A member 2-like isoform X1 n=1 Tax=Aotus nancymaae TaxID=37293 RepID=UPI0030FE794A
MKYLRDELREQERLQEAKMRLWEQEDNENRSALHLEQEGKELQEKLDEQETVPYLNAAGAGAQEEQPRLCEQLQKQQVCCQHLVHPVALDLKEPEAATQATGTGSECGCGETQRALQGTIDKLQKDVMDIVKGNSDLKKRVEKLQLGFIQLSGERDVIRKSIKPPEGQRAAPNSQHQEKEDVTVIIREGMRVKLLDWLEPVFQLLIGQEPQNPASKPTPGSSAPQELGAADKGGFYEVSLEPAGGRVHHNPTAQQMAHGFVSCGTASDTDPWAAVPL